MVMVINKGPGAEAHTLIGNTTTLLVCTQACSLTGARPPHVGMHSGVLPRLGPAMYQGGLVAAARNALRVPGRLSGRGPQCSEQANGVATQPVRALVPRHCVPCSPTVRMTPRSAALPPVQGSQPLGSQQAPRGQPATSPPISTDSREKTNSSRTRP